MSICQPGYLGDSCQESCPIRKFGSLCSLDCNCKNNSTCNSIKGTCPPTETDPYGCKEGFTGDDCYTLISDLDDYEPSNDGEKPLITNVLIYCLVPTGLFLVLGVGLVVYRKIRYPDARIKRPKKAKKKMAWTDVK